MVAAFRRRERKRPVRHPIRPLCCTRCRRALGSFIAGKSEVDKPPCLWQPRISHLADRPFGGGRRGLLRGRRTSISCSPLRGLSDFGGGGRGIGYPFDIRGQRGDRNVAITPAGAAIAMPGDSLGEPLRNTRVLVL